MVLIEKSTRRQYKTPSEVGANFFAPGGHVDNLQRGSVLKICEEIYHCEMSGDLQQAVSLLAPYWTGFDSEINLTSLDKIEAANLLLRIGSVISAFGSAEQIKGSQEKARAWLAQAEDVFDELEDSEGKAQCQNKTGATYWRNGDLETAQIYFRESLFYSRTDESKAIASLNLAMIESLNFRYSSALKLYEKAYQFIGNISVFTEAKIRNGIGLVYKDIGKSLPESARAAYFDKAIIEFEGALICYEEVHNRRSAILALNNIGFLYYSIGLYDDALQVLQKAESQARQLQDRNHLSVVSDTLARTFTAKGQFRRAIEIAAASVHYLESFESSNLLATALITYGIALAGGKEIQKAKSAFYQAEEVAVFIQDFVLAAVARLSALHEMFSEFSPKERLSSYLYVVKNLSGSQDKEISDRLHSITAKIELELKLELPAPAMENDLLPLPQQFSLDKKLKTISREYMEAALRETDGNHSRAAALLGMSRQTFDARMKKDFPDLFSAFSPKNKPVEKVEATDLHSVYNRNNTKGEKFLLTEIQADYGKIRQGDVLLVKLGVPETNKHIIISGENEGVLKIGFFTKNVSGYFIKSVTGDKFELSETGINRIIGEVAGFCRRYDFQRNLVERNEKKVS